MIRKGYFYFIKDYYFEKVKDKELMKNKESGTKRPCFYCFKDNQNDKIIWFVPVSSRIEKYHKIYDKKIEQQIKHNKKPNIDNIVFGNVSGKENAFLIQNMFPTTEKFVAERFFRKNEPVIINKTLQKEIELKANKIFNMVKNGRKGLVFPDILKIKKIMEDEIKKENKIMDFFLNSSSDVFPEEIIDIFNQCVSNEEIKDYVEEIKILNPKEAKSLEKISNENSDLKIKQQHIENYLTKKYLSLQSSDEEGDDAR